MAEYIFIYSRKTDVKSQIQIWTQFCLFTVEWSFLPLLFLSCVGDLNLRNLAAELPPDLTSHVSVSRVRARQQPSGREWQAIALR